MPDLTKSITIFINEGHPESTASFTVPESLLIEKSQYFKDICSLGPGRYNIRTIKLQDVDVEAFNSYMYWTCRDEVAVSNYLNDKEVLDAGLAAPLLRSISNLWLLGARLGDSGFLNEVMDVILGAIEWLDPLSSDFTAAFPPDLITLIWSATTQGQAIRRVVINYYAYMVSPKTMEPLWSKVHPDFFKDLTMRSLDFSQKEGQNIHTSLRELCCYHDHGTEKCASAKVSWESVMSTMAPLD